MFVCTCPLFFFRCICKPKFVWRIYLINPGTHLKRWPYSLALFEENFGLTDLIRQLFSKSLQWQLHSFPSYSRLKVRSKFSICKPEHVLLDIYSQTLKSPKPVNDVKQDKNRPSFLFFLNELAFVKDEGIEALKKKNYLHHIHYESTKTFNIS